MHTCRERCASLRTWNKLAIAQGLANAISEGVPYKVSFDCSLCGKQHVLDLSEPCLSRATIRVATGLPVLTLFLAAAGVQRLEAASPHLAGQCR